MSDSEFVDVGDELVVRISGYPVAKVRVNEIITNFQGEKKAVVILRNDDGEIRWQFFLPLDVKSYDTVDGVGHGTGEKRLVRRGKCTCGEVTPENRLGHADGCRYFSDSVYKDVPHERGAETLDEVPESVKERYGLTDYANGHTYDRT